MLAITPLAINCLITSIGLASIRAARSRTVRLAGISMTLWPFSLITHLRLLASRPRRASGPCGLVEPRGSHHSTSGYTIREPGLSHGPRPEAKRRRPPAPPAPRKTTPCAAPGPMGRPAPAPCRWDPPAPLPAPGPRGSGIAWRAPDDSPHRCVEGGAVGGAASRRAQRQARGRGSPRPPPRRRRRGQPPAPPGQGRLPPAPEPRPAVRLPEPRHPPLEGPPLRAPPPTPERPLPLHPGLRPGLPPREQLPRQPVAGARRPAPGRHTPAGPRPPLP